MKDCSICKEPFDQYDRGPTIICKQQHFTCQLCANQLLNNQPSKCPQCRQGITKENFSKFRPYMEWLQQVKHYQEQLKAEQIKASFLPQMADTIRFLMKFKCEQKDYFYWFTKSKAQMLFQVGKNYAAIILLENLIQMYPNQSSYRFVGLGSRQQQKGYSEGKPLSWYKEKYGVKDLSAEDLLFHLLSQTQSYQGAAQWFNMMTVRYTDNYKLFYGSALNKYKQKDKEGAFIDFKRVVEINPDFSKAYCMMALIKQDIEQCLKYANLCLQKQPTNMLSKLIIALSKGQQDQVISLAKITEQQPFYVRAQNEIGEIFFNHSENQRSIQAFSRCFLLNQHYVYPNLCLSRLYYYSGEYKKAIDLLKLIQNQCSPQQRSQILFIHGLIHSKLKQQQKSFACLKESLQVYPSNIQALDQLASLFKDTHKYQCAITAYKKFIDLDGGSTEIYQKIIQCCLSLGNNHEAVNYLKKSKEIQPNNLEIDCSLGKLFLLLNDWKSSRQHFLACTNKGRYDIFIYEGIIDSCFNMGQYEKALKYLGEHLKNSKLQSNDYDNAVKRAVDINKVRKLNASKNK